MHWFHMSHIVVCCVLVLCVVCLELDFSTHEGLEVWLFFLVQQLAALELIYKSSFLFCMQL